MKYDKVRNVRNHSNVRMKAEIQNTILLFQKTRQFCACQKWFTLFRRWMHINARHDHITLFRVIILLHNYLQGAALTTKSRRFKPTAFLKLWSTKASLIKLHCKPHSPPALEHNELSRGFLDICDFITGFVLGMSHSALRPPSPVTADRNEPAAKSSTRHCSFLWLRYFCAWLKISNKQTKSFLLKKQFYTLSQLLVQTIFTHIMMRGGE